MSQIDSYQTSKINPASRLYLSSTSTMGSKHFMISSQFLEGQIAQSKRARKTTYFLRQLIFSVVEDALRTHYGSDASMKCLQASIAIQDLLEEFGIRARAFMGAVCYSKVSPQGRPLGWNGFWGEDHHIWVVTEFLEYADLTIKEMHLHPASRVPQLPVPALWWDDVTEWPPIIRYLPDAPIIVDLSPADSADLSRFKTLVRGVKENLLRDRKVESIVFEPILTGPPALNELHAAGNPWLRGSFAFQELGIPFPSWIAAREQQLILDSKARLKGAAQLRDDA